MDPYDEGRIHLHVLQFGLQQLGLDGVEGAGEVEEHDVDSSVGSIQGGVGFLKQRTALVGMVLSMQNPM